MIPIRLGCVVAIILALAGTVSAETKRTLLSWDQLDGWAADDHAAAFDVFRQTCRDMPDPDWKAVCAVGAIQTNARTFFELFFRPVLIEDGKDMVFTGYFEPELKGSRARTDRYRYPLYRLPSDDVQARFASRAMIEENALLAGKGLEIAWIDDPVDVFFLQVQGSGRVKLDDGTAIRVGYAGKNGHEYKSVGQELVRLGIYEPHQVSADVIKNWVRRNPVEGTELLRHNPSFVYFREVNEVPWDRGPLGAMNRSITPLRTLAVDPAFTPLGAPVWIEKAGSEPMKQLMIAQDTGSAIKGAQRADIFFGTGAKAGRAAGRIKDPGRMVVLLPIQRAYALAAGP